jgi:POT family proton-dependent oligopeptide transporter
MIDPTSAASASPAGARTSILGHPLGLVTLFGTEFFERFTYYGMRALLVLFLVAATNGANPGFGIDKASAGAVYGLYTGAVYLGCVPGGWIADRLIGQRNAVFWGGLIIAAGNFILAIPATAPVFYLGLAVIVVGVGLLKPNISAMVGALYEGQPGARRDAGFSIFYMGINLGAFVSPLVAGTIGETWNWRGGFFCCGLFMLLGVVLFRFTGRWLEHAGHPPTGTEPVVQKRRWQLVLGVSAILVAVAAWMFFQGSPVPIGELAAWFGTAMFALAVLFFGYVLFFAGLDAASRKRVGVIAIFFMCAVIFWGGFEQQATTFNLFAQDYTDRSALGSWFPDAVHPASWYQSANPLCIILFAPFFAWIWVYLGARNLDPSAPAKMGLGLVLLGVGFLVMMWAAELVVSSGGKVGPTWLLLAYLIHTFGELCLSPVGLSNVTKLSPPKFVGQMMGIWFLGSAIGNLIAGLLGGHVGSSAAADMPGQFLQMALVGGGAGVLILLISHPLRAWIGDRK